MKDGIVLIGPPCCGKSTVGRRVACDLGIDYISSGDIAREMAIDNDDVRVSLDKGMMAPEYEMRTRVYNRVRNTDSNVFILDGFPRTIDQMYFLEKYIKNVRWTIIMFTVDKDQLIERAKNRGRSDDDSFNHRYNFYCDNTTCLVDYAIGRHHNVCIVDNSDGKYEEAVRTVIELLGTEV